MTNKQTDKRIRKNFRFSFPISYRYKKFHKLTKTSREDVIFVFADLTELPMSQQINLLVPHTIILFFE